MSKVVKKAVPKLRFPEFQYPWEVGRIDSFVKRVGNPVEVVLDATYREIGVRSHGKGIFHKPTVTGHELGNKRVFWVHPNAFVVNIVFGWEQAVALTTQNEEGFIASHRFPMFVPHKNKIDLLFMLLFFLRRRGKHLLELASPGGAGRNKTLGQDEFAKLKITVPRIEEQRKIAAFLGAVDAKLDALRRKRELLAKYKRGVMQKLFAQEIRFAQDDGRPFPEWKVTKLGKVANIYDGTHQTPKYVEEGVPFYSVEHITANNFEDTKFISEEAFAKENKRTFLERNDILMTRIGDIGSCRLINWDVRASFYVSLALIKCKEAIRPDFLAQHIQTSFFQRELHHRTLHVAFPRKINLGDIGKCDVKIPHPLEQQKIANFLIVIDDKLTAVGQQITQVETFKKGLLQQMFV